MFALFRPSLSGLFGTAGAAVAVIVLAAACASGSSPTAVAGAPAGSGAAVAAGGSVATVGTRSGPLGSYLVDGSGRALYLFASDKPGVSSCTGSCLTYWPPLTSAGKPSATGAAVDSRVATFAGPGGASRVSYAGHPLYHFALDSVAGDTKGQGLNDFGGLWWLVAPSGQPITMSAPAGSSGAPASSGGSLPGGYGGGGYGG